MSESTTEAAPLALPKFLYDSAFHAWFPSLSALFCKNPALAHALEVQAAALVVQMRRDLKDEERLKRDMASLIQHGQGWSLVDHYERDLYRAIDQHDDDVIADFEDCVRNELGDDIAAIYERLGVSTNWVPAGT